MATSPDFSYVNTDGKTVSGAAAFSHHVYTECGGIANYNDEVGEAYIKEFIARNSVSINNNIARSAKKKRFRKIG